MTHGLKLASPMGFPRQEYQSKLPFPTSGDFSDPGIEPLSPASPALTGGFFTVSALLFFFFITFSFFTVTAEPPGKPAWCIDALYS